MFRKSLLCAASLLFVGCEPDAEEDEFRTACPPRRWWR